MRVALALHGALGIKPPVFVRGLSASVTNLHLIGLLIPDLASFTTGSRDHPMAIAAYIVTSLHLPNIPRHPRCLQILSSAQFESQILSKMEASCNTALEISNATNDTVGMRQSNRFLTIRLKIP